MPYIVELFLFLFLRSQRLGRILWDYCSDWLGWWLFNNSFSFIFTNLFSRRLFYQIILFYWKWRLFRDWKSWRVRVSSLLKEFAEVMSPESFLAESLMILFHIF